MDLLLKAPDKGDLPKDYLELLDNIPVKKVQRLRLFYEKTEMLFNNVFLSANQQLFDSFIGILWSYSDLEEYELGDIKESTDDKSRFAAILSTFKDYYFCKDGLRVLVTNSYSSISYSYLVGESAFHVYDLNESAELGVVMLSKETANELTYLTQRVMEWVGNKPFFANGGEDIYIKKWNRGIYNGFT